MNSDTPIDYALFQLSPRRSHCELLVSGDGKTEKLASGLVKPFVNHLMVAEGQVAQEVQTIKLEVDGRKGSAIWFKKGTVERFVRFVSTPDILELVNAFDAEMSQLEGARRIYSEGAEDPLAGSSGETEKSTACTADMTKKELLKAIDVRLLALKQELTIAFGRASAAGFTLDNISELLLFADRFGAHRLNQACTNFISLCQRRPELLTHHQHPKQKQQQWKEDRHIRSSSSSDMSIDDDPDDTNTTSTSSKPTTTQKVACERQLVKGVKRSGSGEEISGCIRSLSVQDRINLFENKQKEQLGGASTGGGRGGKLKHGSSDVSSSVLGRWSGAGDMSIDFNGSDSFSGRKDVKNSATIPSSSFDTQTHTTNRNEEKDAADSPPRSGTEEDEVVISPARSVPGSASVTLERSSKDTTSKSDSRLKNFHGKVEDTQIKSRQLPSELYRKNFPGKLEETGKRELDNQQGMKLHGRTSDLDQTRSLSKRDEMKLQSNVPPISIGRKPNATEEALELNPTPSEPGHATKPSKRNRELNNELQMKADELEKLFAAHKLRVPDDKSTSMGRRHPADPQSDNMPKAMKQPVEFLPDLGSLDDVRGKFYERYMEKRDAKLREEWGSKRAQKEVKMKALQDNLEHSRAELKARFSGSASRSDSAVLPYRHAERLRNYSSRTAMSKAQHSIDFQHNEEEEHAQKSFEQRDYGDDKFLNETPLSSSSKSSCSKKLPYNRNVHSSTSRSSSTPVPKPSRPINSGPRRHRMQPENPLSQSVPNISNLRKDNTKSPSGTSSIHAQIRTSTCSKSTSEGMVFDKEGKPKRSQSTRKNAATPIELDNSTINSDRVSLKCSKEQNEKKQRNKGMESKSFLRKGNVIGTGSGAGKLSEENSEELAAQVKISQSIVNENDDDEVLSAGESSRRDNENLRLSAGSVDSGDKVLENVGISESFSPVEDDPAPELAASFGIHDSMAKMHESPGESSLSWNSRRSFSYAQEASDIDASVEFPVGSPSWDSHPLNQMIESDSSRVRKKWGSVQKPVIASNRRDVTKSLKRLLNFGWKNKGADYIIKDWISASTNSEGNDDADSGCDPTNSISDDARKSGMRYPQSHPACDGLSENEILQDQAEALDSSTPGAPANLRTREDRLPGSSVKAPRSFFSLSTFRSKGGESKRR